MDDTIARNPQVTGNLKENTIVLINSARTAGDFPAFRGGSVVTINANRIAAVHKLTLSSGMIINTTMLGAIVALTPLLSLEQLMLALQEGKIPSPEKNEAAAREAYQYIVNSQGGQRPESTVSGGVEADLAERYPQYLTRMPPCTANCPAGEDIERTVYYLQNGLFQEALANIKIENPFPGICGRVCAHPSAEHCHRGEFDEGLSTHSLERAAFDHTNMRGLIRPITKPATGLDTIQQAYKTAESIGLPIMVCMDGVYLSYIAETVDIRDQDRVDTYLPVYRPTVTSQRYGYKIFMKEPPQTMAYGRPSFIADRYELFKLESQAVDRFIQVNEEFKSIFGDGYLPVEGYKSDDADVVMVTMGSAVGTCRLVIDEMRKEGFKVGLIKLKMFRPFPKKLIREALAGRKKIAIIDRNISHGQCGFAHQEIKWALNMPGVMPPPTYGFIAGLGGEDITPELVTKAIQFTLNNDPVDQDVIWLGLAEKRQYDDYDKNTIQVR
jgi:hypothetical protein